MQTSSSYIVKGKIGQAGAMVELGLGYSYSANGFCIKDSMFSMQWYVGRLSIMITVEHSLSIEFYYRTVQE